MPIPVNDDTLRRVEYRRVTRNARINNYQKFLTDLEKLSKLSGDTLPIQTEITHQRHKYTRQLTQDLKKRRKEVEEEQNRWFLSKKQQSALDETHKQLSKQIKKLEAFLSR